MSIKDIEPDFNSAKEIRKNLIKVRTGPFYIRYVEKKIWLKVKENYQMSDNLIINIGNNIDKMKQIMSSLILQRDEPTYFDFIVFGDLISLTQLGKNDENPCRFSRVELIESDFLIIKEQTSQRNSLYFGILSDIVNTRLVYNRSTIIFLSNTHYEQIMAKDILPYFKVLGEFGRIEPIDYNTNRLNQEKLETKYSEPAKRKLTGKEDIY